MQEDERWEASNLPVDEPGYTQTSVEHTVTTFHSRTAEVTLISDVREVLKVSAELVSLWCQRLVNKPMPDYRALDGRFRLVGLPLHDRRTYYKRTSRFDPLNE